MPNPLFLFGAGARNRTETGSPPRDFESRASTNFTTPAQCGFYMKLYRNSQSKPE